MNPFQRIYDLQNTGTREEKLRDLPDFPRMLDIELTSSCNFRCLMCPTGNLSLKREAVFMDEETFDKISRECRNHGTAIRFIGWGEPTLHPALPTMILIASHDGLLTHLNTNGSKIDEKMAETLVKFGLSSIKFSFQGANRETYREMRATDFFEGMIEAIKTMRQARGDRELPFIAASTTTTYESPEEIDEFKALLEPLVDQLTIGKTIFDYMDFSAVRLRPSQRKLLERLKAEETVEKKHPDPCPEVFDKLSIHADGSVVVCCNDYDGIVTLGNVNDTPIKELWRHPKIEAYRERLARGDYDAPLCQDCWDYMELSK